MIGKFRFALALPAAPLLALASCTVVPPAQAPRPAPAPAPRPAPAPAPAPSPAPSPVHTSWMDAPRTPGDWSYAANIGGGAAQYRAPGGETLFSLGCDRATGTVSLFRFGGAAGPAPMRILTETATRLLDARPAGGPAPALAASLAARDPLLDAMALSKGRFAVETAGLPTLHLPSWAEVSRVIEDCR